MGDNKFWGESDEIGSVFRRRRVDRVGKEGSFPWLVEILVGSAGSCSAAMVVGGVGMRVLGRGIDMFGVLNDGILAIWPSGCGSYGGTLACVMI